MERLVHDDDTKDLDPAQDALRAGPAVSSSPPAQPAARSAELLSEADQRQIAAAVARAESRTSAEIVPVIARASGRYDRAEDLFGLCLGVALVLIAAALAPAPIQPDSWDTTLRAPFGLLVTVALLVGGCVGGAALASFFPVLSRPFITRAERLACVKQRAADAFLDARVSSTDRRDGLLIYVSLRERMVYVIADGPLQDKIPEGALDPIAQAAVAGFKSRQPAKALLDAVATAGDLLARVAPAQRGQRNELPDAPRQV